MAIASLVGLFFVFLLVVGFEQFFLKFGRHFLVAGETHRECGPSSGDGTEGRGVTLHFFQRHFGRQFLESGVGFHSHDDGAAGLKVAHHVAHAVVGHEDFHVVDGFQDFRPGLFEGVAERMASGEFERDFVGVDGVHFPVVHAYAAVAGIGACERALLHFFHDSF